MDLRFNLCYLDISQRAISHQRTIYLRQKANNWVSVDYRDLSKCQADIGLLVFNFWLWLLVRSWGMEACWKQCIPFHTLTKQEGGFTSLKKKSTLHNKWSHSTVSAQSFDQTPSDDAEGRKKNTVTLGSEWLIPQQNNDHHKALIRTIHGGAACSSPSCHAWPAPASEDWFPSPKSSLFPRRKTEG